nr:hypothetical protein [Tanacetum cinerariifolium]
FQSLKNTNNVKDSELASLFGKLKYEENLIDSIYETEKNKSLIFATPLSTAFFFSSIVQDFQDSPDDEEDTRSSHDSNKVNQCISKQIPFQKKRILGVDKLTEDPSSSGLKDLVFVKSAADDTKVTILGVERLWLSKAEGYILPNHDTGSAVQKQLTKLNVTNVARRVTLQETAGQKLQPTKDFEAKYNKVKAKLALLSLSSSASKASIVKNKGLIAESYERDEEEVSSNENDMVEVKVLMALVEENDAVSKEGAKNNEWLKISMRKDFQDSPDDEEDTRSSHEYLNDLEEEYQARTLLAKSKRFFKKAKYNKVKAKLALLSLSSSASKASMVKNKGLIAESYERDEEEVSSNENEMVEVKVLMALVEENDAVSKKGAKNNEWLKISMRKNKEVTFC